MADMVVVSDSDEEEPVQKKKKEKKVKPDAKFNIEPLDKNGNWRAMGELRKKKQGKGWKVRYCHIVRSNTPTFRSCHPWPRGTRVRANARCSMFPAHCLRAPKRTSVYLR
jgi:hypothetical protein